MLSSRLVRLITEDRARDLPPLGDALGTPASRVMSTPQRIVLVALFVLLYLGVGVFDHELWSPTEPAVAGVTWEMHRTGDLLVPLINGLPYLEKPPLAYIMSWLSVTLGGHMSASLVRLPAALVGLGSIFLVFWIARRLYGEAIAWICAFLCALTLNFFVIMHRASTDSVAIFFTFLCLALFMHTMTPVSRERQATQPATQAPGDAARSTWLWDIAFCAALALSFFVKNFYTYLLVVPPVAIFLLITRQFSRLLAVAAINAVMFTALLIPWCLVLYAHGGSEYLRVVFFDNTLGRFMNLGPPTGTHLGRLNDAFYVHKNQSPLIVFTALGAEMVPWLLIYPAALWSFFRNRAREPAELFMKIAFVSMLVCLTISASRVETYYRAVIFLLALMAGAYLEPVLNDKEQPSARKWRARLLAANFWVVAVVLALSPIAVGVYFHARSLMWLTLLSGLALLFLAAWTWNRWHDVRTVGLWALLMGGSLIAALTVTIPRVEAVKSWRPFFDEVRTNLTDDTELWTTAIDDRKLPAMNFYLDRRLGLIKGSKRVLDLLATEKNVGIIVYADEYDALRPRLAAIPHRSIRAKKGEDLFVYLSSASPQLSGNGSRSRTQ
jgi:4-amino-4-deoxy-L-arabinose transferase-like glycosyltransferase